MEPQILLLLLVNDLKIISEIEDIGSNIGEPDCKLINPYLVEGEVLIPWMKEYTDEKELMISSDKILTLVEPKETLLKDYLKFTQ
jgi:hypothetical protein